MSGYGERKVIKWGNVFGVDISEFTKRKVESGEYHSQNTGSDSRAVYKKDECLIGALSDTEIEGKNICPIPNSFSKIKRGDKVEVFVDDENSEVLINKKDKQKEFEEIKERVSKGKGIHAQKEVQVGRKLAHKKIKTPENVRNKTRK